MEIISPALLMDTASPLNFLFVIPEISVPSWFHEPSTVVSYSYIFVVTVLFVFLDPTTNLVPLLFNDTEYPK